MAIPARNAWPLTATDGDGLSPERVNGNVSRSLNASPTAKLDPLSQPSFRLPAMSLPQTNLQLYRSLITRGASEADLEQIRISYDTARILFGDCFRPNHKPFLCHLIGTAGRWSSGRNACHLSSRDCFILFTCSAGSVMGIVARRHAAAGG